MSCCLPLKTWRDAEPGTRDHQAAKLSSIPGGKTGAYMGEKLSERQLLEGSDQPGNKQKQIDVLNRKTHSDLKGLKRTGQRICKVIHKRRNRNSQQKMRRRFNTPHYQRNGSGHVGTLTPLGGQRLKTVTVRVLPEREAYRSHVVNS